MFETTPIEIGKRVKTIKGKKYTYYEARCTVQAPKGSWRESGSGKTRKEAKDALLKKINEAEMKNSTSVPVRSTTLIDALYHFIGKLLAERVWRESTYSRYKRIVENQIEPYLIGTKHPQKVNHEDILQYLEELRGSGYSDSTLKKAYGLLQRYFNFIYSENRQNNPCYNIKIGYQPKLSKENVLSSDEVARVFRVCDELGGNADLIKFAFMTYERPGEVSTLKFSDWREKEQAMKITRTYTQDKDGHVVVSKDGETKTKSSDRVMKLSNMANELIKKRYNARWQALGKRPGSAYIWTQKKDQSKPVAYSTVNRLWKKVMELAEIDKRITPHGLRHSGITFYGTDRDQFLTISKNAGHSRPSITEDIYSHVMNEHEERAVQSADKLNKLFENGQ